MTVNVSIIDSEKIFSRTFDFVEFENALKRFLQFEISPTAITCNANRGGIQALINALDAIPRLSGVYELPQWPYRSWRWKTPRAFRVPNPNCSNSISYTVKQNALSLRILPPNEIAQKIFLNFQDISGELIFDVREQENQVHINVNDQGLLQFRNLLKTSMESNSWFFVVKSQPASSSSQNIRLTGSLEDKNSFDVFEFVCLEPHGMPSLEFYHNVRGNSSGYLWLIGKIRDFIQSDFYELELKIPQDESIKSALVAFYVDDYDELVVVPQRDRKRTIPPEYIYINRVSGSPCRLISYYTKSIDSLELIKRKDERRDPIILYECKDSKSILEANEAGWNYLLAYLDLILFSPGNTEHLMTYQREELKQFLTKEPLDLTAIIHFGPIFDAGAMEFLWQRMKKPKQFEPITGLPLKQEAIPYSEYINANTLTKT